MKEEIREKKNILYIYKYTHFILKYTLVTLLKEKK